jgi:hypothetical protein
MKILKTILDIVFPLYCVNCAKAGSSLCTNCLAKAHFNEKEVPNFIYPIYDFRDPIIRKGIWALKYKNKKDVANIFAKEIYTYILEELSDLKLLENFQNPLLIPITISMMKKYLSLLLLISILVIGVFGFTSMNHGADHSVGCIASAVSNTPCPENIVEMPVHHIQAFTSSASENS